MIHYICKILKKQKTTNLCSACFTHIRQVFSLFPLLPVSNCVCGALCLCSVPPGLHKAEDALLLPAVLPSWTGAHNMDPVSAHSAAWIWPDERPSPRPGNQTSFLIYHSLALFSPPVFTVFFLITSPSWLSSWWCQPCTPYVKWRVLICVSRLSSRHTRTCLTPAKRWCNDSKTSMT